ncbi:MAG: DUF2726 domain-containing protein [Sedimenticola sp.]
MEWLILVVLFIGIALVVLKSKGAVQLDYPYEMQNTLFTAAERSFFGVLCQAVEGKAVVFGKVRVADVLRIRKGLNPSEKQKAFNKISAKHFDYVLCNPDDLSIIATVELDDSSHSSKTRIARDEFLESVCNSAEVKLHRFKASKGYSIGEVRDALFPSPAIQNAPVLPSQKIEHILTKEVDKTKDNSLVQQNTCPKCSSDLVRRIAKKGQHKGSEFLACSAYPKCRYVAKNNA